jgi:hypothetical protein
MKAPIELDSQLQKSGGKLWGWYIPLDDLMVQEIKDRGWKRLIAYIDDAEPLHCAVVPLGNGLKGITLNKPFVKKNAFVLDQKLHLVIKEDTSKYGMPLSEEFSATLESDPEALVHFENLSPGKQRNLIYFADNVKSSNIRIRRALVVMEHLKMHGGKIDFKALSQEMKEANNREKLY